MDEELKEYLESMRAETRGEFEAMRHENAAAHADTRHQFEVMTERLEGKIALVAEGVVGANERIDRLDAKVEHLGAKVEYLDTKVDHLAAEMKKEFGDVRSLIKFTYTDLDTRVRKLEQH
jgi:outer membrane murein-binding lipoprotein Lpp